MAQTNDVVMCLTCNLSLGGAIYPADPGFSVKDVKIWSFVDFTGFLHLVLWVT